MLAIYKRSDKAKTQQSNTKTKLKQTKKRSV